MDSRLLADIVDERCGEPKLPFVRHNEHGEAVAEPYEPDAATRVTQKLSFRTAVTVTGFIVRQVKRKKNRTQSQ